MAPVRSPHQAAAVAVRSAVEEAILSGELAPGARVNADDHARRMGVSHIPVREALRGLEADGWVVVRRHQGAFVRERDLTELADVFEARVLLEVEVVALAARRRTPEQLDRLDAILARQADTEEPGPLAAVNCEFHVALAACAQNDVLAGYVADLGKRTRFHYLPTAAARRATSLAEHHAIRDAVRDRDADRATDLLRRHIADTRRDATIAVTGAVTPHELSVPPTAGR